jgi:hypothetical protein
VREVAMAFVNRKPWYEYFAVQLLNRIERQRLWGISQSPLMAWQNVAIYSGSLGRLIEQYYWKFRYARAVRSGLKSRAGASRGGKSKAKNPPLHHALWKTEATKIWKSKPHLSRAAVAQHIKRRLRASYSAKHIERVIRHLNR